MKKLTKSVLATCITAALIGSVQAEEIVYDEGPVVRQVGEYIGSPVTDAVAQTETYDQWQQTEQTDIPVEQTIAYEEAQPQQPVPVSSNYDSYAYQEGGTDNYQQPDYQVYEQASLQQDAETSQDLSYQQPVVYEQAQEQPAYEQSGQEAVVYEQAQEQPAYEQSGQEAVVYEQAQEQPAYQQASYQQPVAYEQAQEQPVSYEQASAPAAASEQLSADVLGERLLTAARAGKLGDVRWLLRKGADPEYKLHENALSPLDLVVQGGWVDVAQVFLEEGVDFNKRGNLGITFLHQAAAAGKLPMVKFLVGAGVSPNTTTAKDWTALHHAARFGHADVVTYLLTAGANTEHRNSDGFRPRELAITARHLQIAQMF